jgi:hypothetical protein
LRTGEAIDIIATASAGGTGGGGSVSQVSTAGSGLGFSLTGGPITSIGTVTLATPTASALRGSLTIGNVANANFNGNGSTYLRGNGTFGVINAVAGANTQIQFNDAGVMGATANMTYDIANNNFTVQGTTSLLDNVTVEGHIEPLNDNTYDLGSSTKRFRHVYVGPNSLTIGDIPISQSGSGINFGNSSVATEDFVVNSIANVPGGSNTHVQFNNNGTLGGSAKFTYDGNTMVVMSESSVLGPASFFRVSNTSSGALNAGRIRGTVANPLPVQVGDAAVVSFPMLTANGTATIGGITGFPSGASSFGARVTGLPTVDGGLLSQSLIFSPSSNVANASRTMMTLEYSNVFIATNAANSNVTIASASANSNVFIAASSANSNVTIAPADNATIRIGGGANTKIIMYTQNVPATATSTGTAGQIAFDQNYIYYCWATDQWKRSPLSTW